MLPKYSEITDLIKKGATLEAQEKIMVLREMALNLQEENFDLKKQLKEKDELLKQMQEYFLVQTTGGAVVYESRTEPKHFACPKCYTNKVIHILQNKALHSGLYNCPNCDNTYKIKVSPQVDYKSLHF